MSDLPAANTESRDRSAFRGLIATGLVAFIACLAACDRNVESFQPGEQPSPPDLARIFPGPAEGAGSTETKSIDLGTADRSAFPPSRAEGSAVAGASSAAPIEGRVELSPGLSDVRPDGAVLFVIARSQGARGGPPLAVLRIPNPQFPLEFKIGPENVMIPSMRFEGAVSLSARLDADGNAITRGEGDISSRVAEPLAPGTTDVRLILGEAQ